MASATWQRRCAIQLHCLRCVGYTCRFMKRQLHLALCCCARVACRVADAVLKCPASWPAPQRAADEAAAALLAEEQAAQQRAAAKAAKRQRQKAAKQAKAAGPPAGDALQQPAQAEQEAEVPAATEQHLCEPGAGPSEQLQLQGEPAAQDSAGSRGPPAPEQQPSSSKRKKKKKQGASLEKRLGRVPGLDDQLPQAASGAQQAQQRPGSRAQPAEPAAAQRAVRTPSPVDAMAPAATPSASPAPPAPPAAPPTAAPSSSSAQPPDEQEMEFQVGFGEIPAFLRHVMCCMRVLIAGLNICTRLRCGSQ